MDYLLVKRLRSLFRREPLMPRPIALESSFLGRLPPEIIMNITRFLPTASAASFALCCSSIYETIGTRYWQALQTEDQEQEQKTLLTLLERDLPNHILCYHCNVLHLGTKPHCGSIPLPTGGLNNIKRPACYVAEWFSGVPEYIHEDFRFGVVQMVMKHHRLGLDYRHWLDLLAFRYRMPEVRAKAYRFRTKCNAEARIFAESLFLRKQEVVLVPALNHIDKCLIKICPHVGVVGVHEAQLPKHIECKIIHRHDLKQCVRHSGLNQCGFCFTEYQIDLQESGKHGVVVIVTKWLDLGEGRTIMDPKWSCRLVQQYPTNRVPGGRMRRINVLGPKSTEPIWFEPGSIYASFEQNEHSTFNPVLTQEGIQELAPKFCTVM